MEHKELGVAVIGSGRIGTLRASMAAAHPSVLFLAVSDLDSSRAHTLADRTGAQFFSDDNLEVISRPEVNAVIVSTSEHEHTLPVLQALEKGKPVLVEKPIAVKLEDADRIVAASRRSGVELRVGYTRRLQRHYLLAKEQILQGRLGQILGGTGRVYFPRNHAFQILKRSPEATPVLDLLTYYVDLMCWFLEGNSPVEVVARGQGGICTAAGYPANDVTWTLLTFADGAVVSLGVFSGLPEGYPLCGQSARTEILGTEGVLLFDEDHKESILYTNHGIGDSYVPGYSVNIAFLGSTPPGDWALGDFWGPLASETRAWLDHLSMGRPCCLATPEDAQKTLEVTLAIEQSSRLKMSIRLPLTERR
jgi:predicted dehydrogenase